MEYDIDNQDLNEYWRKRLSKMVTDGAKFGNKGRMCGSCAFKLDSDANLEPENVAAAHECLANNMQFNCHATAGVDKGCECVGFKYAKSYMDNFDRD